MSINFTKMHGCGNDFLIIDSRYQNINFSKEDIMRLANYKKSIGFDQLLIIKNSDKADIAINIFNNDGSEINACGNGSRCVAKLILDEKDNSKHITIATNERILNAKRYDDLISINMGKAKIIQDDILFGKLHATLINIGNPHIIINIDQGGWTKKQNLANIDFFKYGLEIENDPRFPEKVNVNFVSVKNKNLVHLRTWERGAGATLSCGSGSSASFYSLFKQGLINSNATIRQEGGDLMLSLNNDEIILTGEAKISYIGSI